MKRKHFLAVCLLPLIGVLVWCWSATARPVNNPDLSTMWEKADLVVIATLSSNSDDEIFPWQEKEKDAWVPVMTTFAVDAVFKGKLSKPPVNRRSFVTVEHYRYRDPKSSQRVMNGPDFIQFDPDQKSQYLIFLSKLTGGRWKPFTGYIDPRHSFRRLESYSRPAEKKTPSAPPKR